MTLCKLDIAVYICPECRGFRTNGVHTNEVSLTWLMCAEVNVYVAPHIYFAWLCNVVFNVRQIGWREFRHAMGSLPVLYQVLGFPVGP